MADGNGRPDRRKMRVAAAVCALALAGCADDEAPPPGSTAAEPTATTTTTTSTATTSTTRGDRPPPKGEPTAPAEVPPGDPRMTEIERDAERAVRDYLAALDARDGSALCRMLAPDALAEFRLPEARGDCASSLSASIGYRDPRGLPGWESARAAGVRVVEIDAQAATVLARVVTTFADREEASVEDDVVYLERAGGEWLIARPSSTLHRAVGISDIPPSVLAPPSG